MPPFDIVDNPLRDFPELFKSRQQSTIKTNGYIGGCSLLRTKMYPEMWHQKLYCTQSNSFENMDTINLRLDSHWDFLTPHSLELCSAGTAASRDSSNPQLAFLTVISGEVSLNWANRKYEGESCIKFTFKYNISTSYWQILSHKHMFSNNNIIHSACFC